MDGMTTSPQLRESPETTKCQAGLAKVVGDIKTTATPIAAITPRRHRLNFTAIIDLRTLIDLQTAP
jgi:hypothetical protein